VLACGVQTGVKEAFTLDGGGVSAAFKRRKGKLMYGPREPRCGRLADSAANGIESIRMERTENRYWILQFTKRRREGSRSAGAKEEGS